MSNSSIYFCCCFDIPSPPEQTLKSYLGIFPALAFGIGAGIIVVLDTIIWLSMCFALAGPMILGGLYEALLDNRIVDFVYEKRRNGKMTLDMRCRLLMLVLIGNLDLSLNVDAHELPQLENPYSRQPKDIMVDTPGTAGLDGSTLTEDRQHDGIPLETFPSISATGSSVGGKSLMPANHRPSHSRTSQERIINTGSRPLLLSGETTLPQRGSIATQEESTFSIAVPRRRSTNQLSASPWRDMEHLLYPIRLYDDDEPSREMSPRQSPRYRKHKAEVSCRQQAHCIDESHFETETPRPLTPAVTEEIRKTKTRLRTMLNCQYSFGSMVGAPVVFFIGGFIFALLQSLQSLGDEDIALALAFGQWYMIIPHIAIISGLLLAGNNPNILEGIVATQRQEQDEGMSFLGLTFNLTYPSCYKVAWQWHRGHNKKLWIDKLLETYLHRPGDEKPDKDMELLQGKTSLSILDWFIVLFLGALLLGVPFFLAFITAFYTPQVGLSCR